MTRPARGGEVPAGGRGGARPPSTTSRSSMTARTLILPSQRARARTSAVRHPPRSVRGTSSPRRADLRPAGLHVRAHVVEGAHRETRSSAGPEQPEALRPHGPGEVPHAPCHPNSLSALRGTADRIRPVLTGPLTGPRGHPRSGKRYGGFSGVATVGRGKRSSIRRRHGPSARAVDHAAAGRSRTEWGWSATIRGRRGPRGPQERHGPGLCEFHGTRGPLTKGGAGQQRRPERAQCVCEPGFPRQDLHRTSP